MPWPHEVPTAPPTHTSSRNGSLPSQGTDLDVAEPDPVAVILQADVASLRPAVGRPLVVLAGPDPLLPVRRIQLVGDDPLAVEPMLHVAPAHHDAGVVPVADGPGRISRGRVQAVVGATGVRVVEPEGVVADLELGARLVGGASLFGRVIEDATVASVRDLPIDRQLEVVERLGGDEVA